MSNEQPPRRIRLDQMHPAELAIVNAIQEIEKMEADVELTNSQTILQQARDRLADYLDTKHGKFTSLAALQSRAGEVTAVELINRIEESLDVPDFGKSDIKLLIERFKNGLGEVSEQGDIEKLLSSVAIDLQELYTYIGTANQIKREHIVQRLHDTRKAVAAIFDLLPTPPTGEPVRQQREKELTHDEVMNIECTGEGEPVDGTEKEKCIQTIHFNNENMSKTTMHPEDKIKLLENVCRIAGVPDSIIENPQLVWGRQPTDEDIEWAKGAIEKSESKPQLHFLT